MRLVIATIREWNIKNSEVFVDKHPEHVIKLITSKEEFSVSEIEKFNPEYIFFPHWSYYIPEQIYNKFKCIVFHPADLPFARGGSPIQNQIIRGITETKVSAISVGKDIDAGDIYIQKKLSLEGRASDIFVEMSRLVFEEMIPEIIEKNPKPIPQEGEIVLFSRRTPEESKLPEKAEKKTVYDLIRMLDADGYPRAFTEFDNYRIEFENAHISENEIHAEARFIWKE